MTKYILKIKVLIAIQILFSTLCTIVLAAIPYLSMLLFDYDMGRGVRGLALLVAVFALCVVLDSLFQYISQKYEWKTGKEFRVELKKDVFEVVTKLSATQFMQKEVGEYISIINNDVNVLEEEFLSGVIDIVKSAITVIVYGIVLFVLIDARIATVIFATSLIATFVPGLTGKKLAIKRKVHLSALGVYTNVLQSLFQNRNIINTKTHATIANRHLETLDFTEEKLLKFGIFKTFKNVINGIMMHLLSLANFAAVVILLYRGEITIGVGVATIGFVEAFIYPIRYILNDINMINGSKEARKQINMFLNQPIPVLAKCIGFKECIKLENVTIKYDDFAINYDDLMFEKGKRIAIIGHSGSGKSSILNAITKGVVLETGVIYIDGVDVNCLDLANIIAYVPQDSCMLQGNLQENVTVFGAYKDTFTKDFENIIDDKMWPSIVNTDDCRSLSGGEKQIVNLIRALNAEAEILLLDEPFSALDNETASRVLQYLMQKSRTVIMVTHKVSEEELGMFDKVVVIPT